MAHNSLRYQLSLIIIVINIISVIGCLQGISTIGYTYPKGDIVLEYGKNALDIICTITDINIIKNNTNPSALLRFTENDSPITENVSIVNSTSIRLYDLNPTKQSSTYTCQMDKEVVCFNMVVVGTKPIKVDDFNCKSLNFDNLTCTWTPKDNFAKITHNLSYTFPEFKQRRNICPQIEGPVDKVMSCFWNRSTEPLYRQNKKIYTFNLTMTNKLGSKSIIHELDQFKRVIPAPPKNLRVVNKTHNSVVLQWNISHEIVTMLEPGLNYKVLYQCEYGPRDWKLGGMRYLHTGLDSSISRSKKYEVEFELVGLQHAHDLCDIRVSLRSHASDDINMWSSNSSVTVRTASTLPGKAPKTNIGSYELVEKSNRRDVYIYWSQIPEEIKNGEDFRYNVTIINGDTTGVKLNETTNAYAKYENLLLNSTYMFEISSQNAIGKSPDRSYVTIASKVTTPPEPTTISKILHEEGEFEIMWEPPKTNATQISNFTVFWCSNFKERPYQCLGHLNWKEVSSDVNSTRVKLDDTDKNVWQFAVSANTENYSSGMVWAGCTILHNKYIGKIREVWLQATHSKSVEVAWKLECIDRIGSVAGFIIYYCPVSVSPSACNGVLYNVSISDSSATLKRIGGLKPYTTYGFRVSVITKRGDHSEPSDFRYQTTLEAAPSSPSQLKVVEITNSSITISWKPPLELNGAIKYYEVSYNNRDKKKIDKDIYNSTLDNLVSYEMYHIMVKACTTECSEGVAESVRTKIGYPDIVKDIHVSFRNQSWNVISWDKPLVARGELDFYEVNVKLQENKSIGFYNVTTPTYLLQCEENGEHSTLYLSIRAVNLMDGVRFDGTWSNDFEWDCSNHQTAFIYFILAIVGVLIIAFISYGAKKLYKLCGEMRDVDVKMPDGLQPNDPYWNSPKIQDDMGHRQPTEEELFPLQDSSGCSSGHESVASESGTNTISNASDSGTDTNELRKRPRSNLLNTSVMRTVPINPGYITMPSDLGKAWPPIKPNDATSGVYCKLGVDPESILAPAAPQDDKFPYISCDEVLAPVPYVVTGDKPSNSGYVPLNFPNLHDHRSPYVMAGTQNILIPELPRHQIVTAEEKPFYVQISDAKDINNWQKPLPMLPVDNKITNKGYVSIGDALPSVGGNGGGSAGNPKRLQPMNDAGKGYIPHRQFDATMLLKED